MDVNRVAHIQLKLKDGRDQWISLLSVSDVLFQSFKVMQSSCLCSFNSSYDTEVLHYDQLAVGLWTAGDCRTTSWADRFLSPWVLYHCLLFCKSKFCLTLWWSYKIGLVHRVLGGTFLWIYDRIGSRSVTWICGCLHSLTHWFEIWSWECVSNYSTQGLELWSWECVYVT